MSKIERLNGRVEKLLSRVVLEVLEVVKETVSEYQEKTARTQRENQSLKKRLKELQDELNLRSKAQQAKVEQREKKGMVEDSEVHPADEDIADSFADNECGASISSFATLCPSPKATTTPRCGVVNWSDPGIPKSHTDNGPPTPSTNHLDPFVKIEMKENYSDLSFTSNHIKIEPTTHEETLHKRNDSSDDAATSSTSFENPQTNSELNNTSWVMFSPGRNSTEEPPSHRHNNTNCLGAGKPHSAQTNLRAGGSDAGDFQRNVRNQYCCSVCGRTFGQAGDYKAHSRVHTREKPYCCSVCGRTFGHAGDYKKHSRVHTGEKPYCCSVCGKRFSQSGYLTVHLRYHTGEKPYGCSHCGKSFSHSSNMKKHLQTHL